MRRHPGKIPEADLVSIGPPVFSIGEAHGGSQKVIDRASLGPSYGLMAVGEWRGDEYAAGVVGIGHEQDLAIQDSGDRQQQTRQLIEQGSGIASWTESDTWIEVANRTIQPHLTRNRT